MEAIVGQVHAGHEDMRGSGRRHPRILNL